jgi:integrase
MVGHIMRLAAYLCTSRHGIFYFRFPIPADINRGSSRSHIKLSLGTRDPNEAKQIARALGAAGQSLVSQSKVRSMRYDEMRRHVREHFSGLLQKFRERSADQGPPDVLQMSTLETSQGLADADDEHWLEYLPYENATALLEAFCAARGIPDVPDGREAELLMAELRKGHREYVQRSREHVAEFDRLSLDQATHPAPVAATAVAPVSVPAPDARPLADVLSRYFDELDRTEALAAKTRSEKQDALSLMSDLTGAKAPALLTKADAQEVKAALLKLPKNRSKNPKTRTLSLTQMLDLKDVPKIAARTLNVYLGHMQHFMGWAVDNGYAAENVFTGMRLKKTAKGTGEGRQAFKADELQVMYEELTNSNSVLVKKDVHRWPALIGTFTGMRLNEVAQLEVQDIEERDGVWCINVTPDGDDQKRLKNASSRRLVPVHDRLLDCGFLGFLEGQREAGSTRLFPSLTYTPQNGYGRNAGRWFNDQFLPKMGLGGQGLTFHCLRHTMITRLMQAGAEEPQVKAIVGHTQTGVTLGTYFKASFLPQQLQTTINKFDF